MVGTTERERFLRLLIVEDDPSQLRTLTSIMQQEGFDVIGASTTADAMKHIGNEDFGVAVVDLRLGDGSGTQLLAEIQRLDRQIRVIINTAYGSFDSAMEAINLGAFAYVEKASDPEELVRRVHAAARWHLDRYAKGLEAEVAKRTADLRQTNEDLKRQIAERKRAEEALRESRERFKLLYERTPIGYQSLDERGYFLEVNQAWLDVLGYDREEVIGEWFGDFLSPECVEHFRRSFPCFKSQGEIHRVEFQMIRKDGARILVEYDGKIGFDEFGEFEQTHCVLLDITQRKRAEQELARHREHLKELVDERTRELEASQEKLRRAERLASIGTFAAGIAHEINNPLGMVLLGMDAALESLDDVDSAEKLLRRSKQDVERCARIVKGVLQFARRQATEKWSLDLNRIVRQSLDFSHEYARDHGVAVRLRLSDKDATIRGNATELEQVAVNLIHNAVNACGSGGEVTIETDEARDSVRLTVRDNGCGMTAEQIGHAFDPFFTTRLARGGTGLGLSTAHGIVTEHGGTIDIASQEGKGTTITAEFPRHIDTEATHGQVIGR